MGDFNQEYRPKLESQISSLKVLQRMCEKTGVGLRAWKSSTRRLVGKATWVKQSDRKTTVMTWFCSLWLGSLHQVVSFLRASVSSSVTSVGCNT